MAVLQLGLQLLVLHPDSRLCGAFTLTCATTAAVERAARASASTASGSIAASGRRPGREAIALVMHTSGTTRRPKVVPLTHASMGIGALCVRSTLRLDRTALALNVMPLFHLHGLMVNVLVTALAGAPVLCLPRFEASQFFACLGPRPTQPSLAPAADAAEAPLDAPTTAPTWYSAVPTIHMEVPTTAPTWYSAVPTIHMEVLRVALSVRASTGMPPSHQLAFIRNCSAALAPSIGEQLEEALPGAPLIASLISSRRRCPVRP